MAFTQDVTIFHFGDVTKWAAYYKSKLGDYKLKVMCLPLEDIHHYDVLDSLAFFVIVSPMFDLQTNKKELLEKVKSICQNCVLQIIAACGRAPHQNDFISSNLDLTDKRMMFEITSEDCASRQTVKNIAEQLEECKTHLIDVGSPPLLPPPPPLPQKPRKISCTAVLDAIPPPPPPKPKPRTSAPQLDLSGSSLNVNVFPSQVRYGEEVLVLLQSDVNAEVLTINLENRTSHHTGKLKAQRRQKHVFGFRLRDIDIPPGVINCEVYHNQCLGSTSFTYNSTSDHLSQVLDEIQNPMQVLAQSVGLDAQNTPALDRYLAETIKSRSPRRLSVVFKAKSDSLERKAIKSELPTLLHFAAKYGLTETSHQLLRIPGVDHSLKLRNKSDLTPAQLAHNHGHEEIGRKFDDFMESSEDDLFLFLISTTQDDDDDTYEPCMPASDDVDLYDIDRGPPTRSNTLTSENYMTMDSPASAEGAGSEDIYDVTGSDDIYEVMNKGPTLPKRISDLSDVNNVQELLRQFQVEKNPLRGKSSNSTLRGSIAEEDEADGVPTTQLRNIPPLPDKRSSSSDSNVSSARSSWNDGPKRPSLEDVMQPSPRQRARRIPSALEELLELQNQFKNNEFNQNEVLRQFEQWQKRYPEKQNREEKKTMMNGLKEALRKKAKYFKKGKSPKTKAGSEWPSTPSGDSSNYYIMPQMERPVLRGARPDRDSTLSTTSTTSGTSSRSSGISTSDEIQDDAYHYNPHKRVARTDQRQTDPNDLYYLGTGTS